jgi:hypothetical protein
VNRWLAVALVPSLVLSAPIWAAEPVELEAGQPAPFKGSLCDKDCAARVVAKVEAANRMRDRCYEDLKAKPSTAPSLLGAAVALVIGVLVGGAAVAIVKK